MAIGDGASRAAVKFSSLTLNRQIGLLVGLAASIAIGVGVVLWSREPSYTPLYNQLNSRDSHEVVEVLQRNGFVYKINKRNGTILVESDVIQQARMKLASEGLPRGNGRGFELFANSNSFTTSQYMESAKLKLALETELARTITQFNHIKAARVHLAIPRESAFVRDTRKPSASIFIDVYSGFQLKKNTVSSIVNLVASSISNLDPDDVTVVDQNGQLLNEGGGESMMAATDRYMDYQQQLEQNYAKKIRDLLTPILGIGKVKAKVSADLDFTQSEQTREIYNPDMAALRSEQTMQEKRKVNTEAAGVAGAQANQANASQAATTKSATTQQGAGASDFRTQATKNYELDKTISHTRHQPGRIKRLTVAVLVDNRQIKNPKTGKMETKKLTADEIKQIKLLVADAIGMNANRGDSLNVINSSFFKPEPIEPLPEPSLWQQAWFISLSKQVAGGIFVLLLLFGVLRPILKSLAVKKEDELPAGEALSQGQIAAPGSGVTGEIGQMKDYDNQLNMVQQMAGNEPKRVAQVVKNWVDGG